MSHPISWSQVRKSEDFIGRWVALDHCRFDRYEGQPTDGMVVDSDENLDELCRRLREAERGHCTIVYCEEEYDTPPSRVSAVVSHQSLR
jgi:hypothetical protein